jgi:hypothetical protein
LNLFDLTFFLYTLGSNHYNNYTYIFLQKMNWLFCCGDET